MKLSYEGIGAWSATFAAKQDMSGQVVKITTADTVEPCADGNAFCGVAGPERNGVCAVQMSGFAEVPYTGSAPAVGKTTLSANGSGGVKADPSGAAFWVVSVDKTAEKCVIKL